MYGSAGSHSAGSLPLDVLFRQARAIGLGNGVSEVAGAYDFRFNSMGVGVASVQTNWIYLEVAIPIGSGIGLDISPVEVIGNIDIDAIALGLGLGSAEVEGRIILDDVPVFTLSRTATEAEIEVLNRQGREVKIYRADNYNISYVELTNINSDSHTDSIEANKSYKYKLAFRIGLTPEIIGQRSTGKYTR